MIAGRCDRFLLPRKIIVSFCFAISTLVSTVAAQTSAEKHFFRVSNDRALRKTVLQLPVRKFERHGMAGPSVTLQSMVHIADRSFFEKQQEIAESHDVILFEVTKLAGAGPLKYSMKDSESAESRIALTKTRLSSLGFLVKEQKKRDGKLPQSFSEMEDKFHYLRFHSMLAKDGWGNDFQFRILRIVESNADNSTSSKESSLGDQLEILSWGKDNRQGGEGEDADILLSQQDLSHASIFAPLKAMQDETKQVARHLGMEFQFDVMTEESRGWRNSDLAEDQILERLQAAGVSLDSLSNPFASFPVAILTPMLKLVNVTPSLKDAGKLVFLEMIEKSGPEQKNQFAMDGLEKVIVVDRNQVVIDDLNDIIEQEPQIKSVSIVYGGGHMPNFEMRLKEMGYQETSVTWVDAITVQLPKNPVEKMKFELARNLLRKVISQVESEADKHMELGFAARDRDEALKEFQKAFVLFEETVKKSPKEPYNLNRLASCCDQIGLTYQTMGQLGNAGEYFGKGERIRRSLVERYPKDWAGKKGLAWSLARLGEISLEMGQSEKALGFFQEGRDIYLRAVDADPKNMDLKSIVEWYDVQIRNVKQAE